MGKVREETSSKVSKAASGKDAAARPSRGRVWPFFANLARTQRYKPTQGKSARLWTAVGLGIMVGAGLYTYYNFQLSELPIVPRYLSPVGLAAVLAWLVWRVIEFPPFVDFLIATEAEMTKISWTTKDDLQRATMVVLTTVLIMSLFLAGVDVVWSLLLNAIGVLRFGGGGGFGSQAG